jgi:7,8-dihydropterin-6-yl-methyl-4-(beta-D-ribofuranosyl)aminobenzene 5'-phosphate synthase
MKRTFPLLALAILLSAGSHSQTNPFTLSQAERDDLKNAIATDSVMAQWAREMPHPAAVYEDFKRDLWRSDSAWNYDQQHLQPLPDIGTTRRFELLPLIDRLTSDDSLLGESGVSYLIRTDSATILYDVGANARREDPSPLVRNMKRLGVSLGEIDFIVISHPHSDHNGGVGEGSFALTRGRLDLPQIEVFIPTPMTYPGLNPVCRKEPTRIANGVATIGLIDCPLFIGSTVEQALAVSVEGKGMVIISGCGHETLEKIVARTESLFGHPPYGILGGFHLPTAETGRLNPILKYVVTGRLPWKFLEAGDIVKIIDLLKRKHVRLVGISPHDSSDLTIDLFRKAFDDSYTNIAVGTKVTIP